MPPLSRWKKSRNRKIIKKEEESVGMFKTKYYSMYFQKGKEMLLVTIVNRQLHVEDLNKIRKTKSHIIVNCSDEHECISMIAYYYGMGYVLTKFRIQRMMIISWEEREQKERGIDIWEKWKQQKKS